MEFLGNFISNVLHVSLSFSKVSYFYFSFKLNEKKKMPLKINAWRRGYRIKFLLERGFDL